MSSTATAGPSTAIKQAKQTAKKDKSQKKTKASNSTSTSTSAGFSLLGSSKDVELDDVFGKSSSFAPPPPVTPIAPSTSVASGNAKGKKRSAEATEQPAGKKSKAASKSVPTALAPKAIPTNAESEVVVSDDLPDATQEAAAASNAPSTHDEEASEASDSDEDGDPSTLVHESVSKPKKTKIKPVKYTPPDESAADKARRSLFIGNLPVDCANAKKGDKQLIAHLLTFAPTAKVESVRFRSIAFKTPTSGTGEDDGGKAKKRETERASAWKAEQAKLKAGGKEAEEADRAKTFLDSKGKRKVAFIKKDFHEEAATCNAYIVFAHPHPDRSANVAPIMNPYEAASAVLNANGSLFMSRHIRVDTLRDVSKVALANATTALGKRDAWLPSGTDPKKSVFVGGLDYAAKEEDVRAFFEALLVSERGKAEAGEWVKEVRIIRDKDTQLGKGFGYVHFGDRQSVDEVLALDAPKLKFARKTLRVQPAKTLPAPLSRPPPEAKEKTPYKGKVRNVPSTIPVADASYGDKIKDLSKEDRKLAKATDAERQARRLAKKQKRVAMKLEEKGAVKLGPAKSGVKKADKAKKSRVRSSHALSKMKGSRQ